MEGRKLLLCAVLALSLGLAAHPGNATVVTSIPGGMVISMPNVNYHGLGPKTFWPGITWTSTYSESNFGYSGAYNYSSNGGWTGDLGPMAGLNASTGTMTFTFSTPVSAVGGFLNYSPGSDNPTIIAVYDASNHLIKSFNLTFTTDGGVDTGFFYGFEESANIISSFTLTDNYVGIVNLTTKASPVPLPGAIWLLGSGLLGLAGMRKQESRIKDNPGQEINAGSRPKKFGFWRNRLGTRALVAIMLPFVLATPLGAGPAHAGKNPLRNVYFGETHVHTGWSFDAYLFGNKLTGPEEAYKYALGKPIKHPVGYTIQLKHPLDWVGVTDHSEYAGTVRLANEPGSAISKLPIAEKLKVRNKADIQRIFAWLGDSLAKNQPVKELVDPQVAGAVWKQNVAFADRFYRPGKFTTFPAYEWTSTPNNCNLHRNILFKDSKKVPEVPFSSLDSRHPEDLWKWMDGQRQSGHEVLAISHNANLSDGLIFPTEVDSQGRPLDAAWAQERMRNEPLL